MKTKMRGHIAAPAVTWTWLEWCVAAAMGAVWLWFMWGVM